MLAPETAGVIHTDFQRGFIRAEVISYEDFVKYKGETGSKNNGKMRIEERLCRSRWRYYFFQV